MADRFVTAIGRGDHTAIDLLLAWPRAEGHHVELAVGRVGQHGAVGTFVAAILVVRAERELDAEVSAHVVASHLIASQWRAKVHRNLADAQGAWET